jgi:hypothetical protein
MPDSTKRVFKKFSDFKTESKKEKSELKELELSDNLDKLPMNPNLPNEDSKVEVPKSTDELKPEKPEKPEKSEDIEENNEKVKTFGKIAKFPKNVKASKAYNFMENVKISKKSIWYLMVEKDENELQMVKYNYNEGVDLSKFVNDLKTYYLNKYKGNKTICEAINKLNVDGNDKYSMVKGITPVEVDGKKLITKITEDLIKLLSK